MLSGGDTKISKDYVEDDEDKSDSLMENYS